MGFQYVYVLTSYEDDFYADQASISIYSLKQNNPDAHVILITDKETLNFLPAKNIPLKSQVDEIVTPIIPDSLSRFQKSRFLKTSIRNFISGDFVFLDTDTIILNNLRELESLENEIAVTLQQDHPEGRDWTREDPHFHIKKYNIARGVDEDCNYGINNFYNSGVMLCRDTEKVHQLFDKWHSSWYESSTKHNYHADQCDLWVSDAQMGEIIQILDGKFNFEAIYPMNAFRYYHDCRIFHYFSNSKKFSYLKVKSPEFLLNFRKNGFDNEIVEMIENIRMEYISGLEIKDKNVEIKNKRQTSLEKIGKKLSEKFPFLEKIASKALIKTIKTGI